jgi:hypothetical protein
MTKPQDKDRPEAGADTEHGRRGEGATARDAGSGGTRTAAGGTYGDHVPSKPRGGDDREREDPAMGDYYTGGGNIDRLGEEPAGRAQPPDAGEQPQAHDEAEDEAEKIAEDNRNKPFDTTHTHSSTTSRKV